MTAIDTHQTLTEGDLIQWYRVEKILGRGGFGVTYLATDTNLDHRVAIKEFLPGPLVNRQQDNSLAATSESTEVQYREGLQRFLREAQTLVKFRHPNIVRVMAVFEANNTAYLVMEYEEGEQFKEYVKRDGGISEIKLTSLLLSVIDGLDQVHQHGFIHRDIKPVNLIIRNDGSPVLLDFGSTRPVENDLKVQHTSFVSVGYTPLEQYQEGAGLTVGPWTDIYSLGATLYYAISGVTPVSPISRLAALVKKSKDPLQPAIQIGNDNYSESFLRAIDWALGFRIEDRPQTLSEWKTALQVTPQTSEVDSDGAGEFGAADENKTTQTAAQNRSKLLVRSPEPARKPVQTSTRRSFGVLRLLGIVALCLVVATVASLLHRNQQTQRKIDELVIRADSAFTGANAFKTARPLYQQVLESDPDNQHAQARLKQISNQWVEKAVTDTKAGRFDQAEKSIRQLDSIGEPRAANLGVQLKSRREVLAIEGRINEVEGLIDQSSYAIALTRLSTLRDEVPDHPLLDQLESIARQAIQAEQDRRTKTATEHRARERTRLATQQKLAAATERQRQRRRDYRSYLNSAEQALQSGQIESARKWINNATALQINDEDLEDIEARVAAAESFLTRPLSDYELSYAREQFGTLERAIESKNMRAINELTEATALRRGLFETLFERYTQISVRIMDIESKPDPKRVTAVLRIEKMVMPNGDVVYPSSAYRDSALSLVRKRYSWAPISW